MRRALLLLLLAVCAVALLAGSREHIVGQMDKSFSISELTVRKGDTVRFTNDDTVTHNVFARGPVAEFNVKMQEPGSSDTVRFEKAGVQTVRCAIHPQMKLVVTVEE